MLLENNILITGINSGLGKFLHEEIKGSIGLNRENKNKTISSVTLNGVDTIIHCAFNSKRDITDHYAYLNDNIFLTQDLLKIPHKKFIYLSTIDIYRDEESSYKLMKELAESVVQTESNNFIIARCPAMLGRGMRKNTFVKMYERNLQKTGLSADSTFNYILYEDILNFFTECIQRGTKGIFNLVSKTTVSLGEISAYFDYYPEFGNFIYATPKISCDVPSELSNIGSNSSLSNIKRFIKDYEK